MIINFYVQIVCIHQDIVQQIYQHLQVIRKIYKIIRKFKQVNIQIMMSNKLVKLPWKLHMILQPGNINIENRLI